MGAHSKPNRVSTSLRMAAVGSAAATVALATGAGTADAAELAPGINWDPIIQCESGGIVDRHNPSSSASGLYQFLTGSWLAYGGGKYAPTAGQATAAQQTEIANIAYAQSGLSPWAASQSCWGGKVNTSAPSGRHASGQAAPAHAAPAAAPKHAAVVDHRNPDGTGTYVCDSAHFAYAACDPDTVGQVEHYPAYAKPAPAPAPAPAPVAAPAAPAAVADVKLDADVVTSDYTVKPGDTLWGIAVGHDWQRLYGDPHNRQTVGDNPDLILPGEVLHV